jgi:hypothetical protein
MQKELSRWFGAAAVLAFAFAVGCGPSLGPSKAVSALTPQEARGRAVYQQYWAKFVRLVSEEVFAVGSAGE